MDDRTKLIGVRHVKAGNLLVAVELFRNDGGSVAARCLLDGDERPIIDADTAEEALAAVQDSIEGLVLARAAVSRASAPAAAANRSAAPPRRAAVGER